MPWQVVVRLSYSVFQMLHEDHKAARVRQKSTYSEEEPGSSAWSGWLELQGLPPVATQLHQIQGDRAALEMTEEDRQSALEVWNAKENMIGGFLDDDLQLGDDRETFSKRQSSVQAQIQSLAISNEIKVPVPL